jgi:hypothetical protein
MARSACFLCVNTAYVSMQAPHKRNYVGLCENYMNPCVQNMKLQHFKYLLSCLHIKMIHIAVNHRFYFFKMTFAKMFIIAH